MGEPRMQGGREPVASPLLRTEQKFLQEMFLRIRCPHRMKLDTVEIKLSRAASMLPCMQSRIEALTEKRNDIDRELGELKALQGEITAALENRVVHVSETANGSD